MVYYSKCMIKSFRQIKFVHVCMMFIWREQVFHLIFHVVSSLLAK